MSLLGLSPTITATRTLAAPLQIAHVAATNIRIPTSYTRRTATTTTPATTSDTGTPGNNRIVLGASMNYLHCVPVLNTGGIDATMNVLGWTRTAENVWIPRLLTSMTVTSALTTLGTQINSVDLYAGRAYVKVIGDVKSYNGDANICTVGGVVVDLLGSELVEISMSIVSGTVNYNALVAFI